VFHCQERQLFATVNGSDMDHSTSAVGLQRPGLVESVTVWDSTTGQELRTLAAPDPSTGPCHDVAFDAGFSRIAWARGNGSIEIRDATTDRTIHSLVGHKEFVWRVAFSPDGRLVASAGRDAKLRVWDAGTGRLIHVLPGFSDLIVDLSFSPDGRRLALAGADFDLIKPEIARVWDVATGRQVAELGESFDYATMTFHPDSRRLARSLGADIQILEVAGGPNLLHLRGHTEVIMSMAFSPDGLRLASAARDGTIKLWELQTGREVLTLLYGRGELLTGLSFSPDGRQVVSVSMSGTVKVWDATPLPVNAGE
jgi:WD40 repeat protein